MKHIPEAFITFTRQPYAPFVVMAIIVAAVLIIKVISSRK